MPHSLKFSRLPGSFAVCRLLPGSTIPSWGLQGSFFSVARSADELSIVCPASQVPKESQHESGWACFKLAGPFPFAETGILSSFIQPLSDRAIPIFAISTYDTDYVLVKEPWVDAALRALEETGHQLV
jgi:hypothetical protein